MENKINFEILETITEHQKNISNSFLLYCAEKTARKRSNEKDKERRKEQFKYKEVIMPDFQYSIDLQKLITRWWTDELKWYKENSKEYEHESLISGLLYRIHSLFFRNHMQCPFINGKKLDNKDFIVENQKLFKRVLNQSIKNFSVDVVMKKYLYHLPLERIRRVMESGGLRVATKTLYGLCFFVHCYLEDMAERIRGEILSCGLCVHLDETSWPIGNSKQSDGYLWVLSNQGGSYYRFEPTRSGKIAKELLGPYGGPVVVDGYSGYKSGLRESYGVDLAFCWSHVRRKFTDIEGNYPGPCGEILDKIGRLFEIERRASNYEFLRKLRKEESGELTKQIRDWLFEKKPEARSESHLLKAINYTLNHWDQKKKQDRLKVGVTIKEIQKW